MLLQKLRQTRETIRISSLPAVERWSRLRPQRKEVSDERPHGVRFHEGVGSVAERRRDRRVELEVLREVYRGFGVPMPVCGWRCVNKYQGRENADFKWTH